MAFFTYKAADPEGNLVEGSMEARDTVAVAGKLREMGYYPMGIGLGREVSGRGAAGLLKARRPMASKVSGRELSDMTRELAGMLESGLPIDKSLSILAGLAGSRAAREVLLDLVKGIKAGRSLADCMEGRPDVFSRAYVSSIRAGETGGTLVDVLNRLSSFMDDVERLKEDVRSALIYPLILVFVGGAAVSVMLFFVVPRFASIFDGTAAVMPLPTRMLMALSGAVSSYWPFILVFLAASVLAARLVLKTDGARLWVDRSKLGAPVAGPVLTKVSVSRFARTLGMLLQGGIPILDAMRIASGTVGNVYLATALEPVAEGVRRGRGLAGSLGGVAAFPSLAVHLVAVGEESGRLEETLLRLADKYDRDVATAIKRLLTLLEPAIILFMALIVGFIVVSLVLAVFSINDMPM